VKKRLRRIVARWGRIRMGQEGGEERWKLVRVRVRDSFDAHRFNIPPMEINLLENNVRTNMV